VADAWTGETIADVLQCLIAQMARAQLLTSDVGGEWHKAVALLDAQEARHFDHPWYLSPKSAAPI